MRHLLFLSFLLLTIVPSTNADWWDSFTDKVANAFTAAGEWWKNDASPKVRETFDSTKEKLKDPEFHKGYMEWIKEKAIAAKEFADAEIMPHVKEIYQAAEDAVKQVKDEDMPVQKNQNDSKK
ncbi:unnamed protein product, partial [Mesorhabditis belari]|uniref:Uncharacterized protein n=1 Tax=Mesorhabditis belari TaxID=2138241 RepID=A0AAF3FIV9_9BILA